MCVLCSVAKKDPWHAENIEAASENGGRDLQFPFHVMVSCLARGMRLERFPKVPSFSIHLYLNQFDAISF